MSIREGLREYYNNFGVRGILAISAYRVFRHPAEITARAPGIRNRVSLRVRTSDPVTYGEILLRRGYGIDLPFSPKTIVDGGANIGMASIYFTHRYPEAKIIAIEPEVSNFALLARNVRHYPAITPVHAALWNRDGHIGVVEPDPATGASGKWGFVTRDGPGVKVPAITMHALMRDMCITAIDLAKIDIEGAEQEVFEDTRWLNGTRCLMIELHDRLRPGCSEAVEPLMHGFARTQRGDMTFFVRETEHQVKQQAANTPRR